MKECRQ